jgi:hypothetical protein
MTNLAPHRLKRETSKERRSMSEADQKKLIEGQLQLEGEDEARKRRVKIRKQRQAMLAVKRRAQRRTRAFKLAGFWTLVIIGGFFAMAWYSNDVMALIK